MFGVLLFCHEHPIQGRPRRQRMPTEAADPVVLLAAVAARVTTTSIVAAQGGDVFTRGRRPEFAGRSRLEWLSGEP